MFRVLHHYVQKLKIIGPYRFFRAVWCRICRRVYIAVARVQIFFGIHETKNKSFPQKGLKPIPDFLQNLAHVCDREKVITMADEYVAQRFDLLGSAKQSFDRMPWHEDFRLSAQDQNADCLFDAQKFYADIQIKNGASEKYSKDIKLPWELSRFHYLPVLAYAYTITGDVQYADAAKQQVIDWLDSNPYLFGVNWLCPMEVAIRATNWIIALQWLQERFCVDESFYQRMCCSLYDHKRYLEHNWEYYDGRTCNHYLSNLVGYLYLCYFFDDAGKFDWCYQELLREFEWQIFDEGTSYEGSTKYHQLVTELFLHGFLLTQSRGKNVSSHWAKLNRMIEFLEWCKPSCDAQMILIGDDDSGSLLHKDVFRISNLDSHISDKHVEQHSVKHYKQFGLSIIKTNDWHVTLRHHAYTNRQPSGHFHNDVASMTLAYKGVPILVDPGSYLYTASSWWRNQFRSAFMHNTVLVDGCDQSVLDDRLFALNIPEGMFCDTSGADDFPFSINTNHMLYADIHCSRKVVVERDRCTIFDRVLSLEKSEQKQIVSTFSFGVGISLQQCSDTAWLLIYNKKPILKLLCADGVESSTCYPTWLAPMYGKKIPVNGIRMIWNRLGEPCSKIRIIAM